MAKPDTQKCSRCGGGIGNGDITQAVTVNYLTEAGDVATLKVCLTACARKVITARAYPHAGSGGPAKPAKAER